MELNEQAAPVASTENAKVKRKYTAIKKGDFIRISNSSQSVREISEKTGMSYNGVKYKLAALKTQNVALKKILFQDHRKLKQNTNSVTE